MGNKWDVKTAISKISGNPRYKFKPSAFAEEIIKELNLGENILVDASNLVTEDLTTLEQILKSNLSSIKTDCITIFIDRNKNLN